MRFLHGDWVHTIAFFPDSKVLLGGSNGPALRLWDIGGDDLGRLAGDGSSISPAALSPNAKVVAAGDNGGNLFLWDVASAKVLHKIPARVSTVSWSGDGKILAAAGGGGAILLIDPATGNEIGRLQGHKDFVLRVAFAEKGSLLVSAARLGKTAAFVSGTWPKRSKSTCSKASSIFTVCSPFPRTANMWPANVALPLVPSQRAPASASGNLTAARLCTTCRLSR